MLAGFIRQEIFAKVKRFYRSIMSLMYILVRLRQKNSGARHFLMNTLRGFARCLNMGMLLYMMCGMNNKRQDIYFLHTILSFAPSISCSNQGVGFDDSPTV